MAGFSVEPSTEEHSAAELAWLVGSKDATSEQITWLLVSGYSAFVHQLANFVLSTLSVDPGLASEASERAILQAASDHSSFAGWDKVRAWLAQYVITACREIAARRKPILSGKSNLTSGGSPGARHSREISSPGRHLKQDILLQQLDRLPPHTRVVLFLRYHQGLSIPEIAKIFSADQKNVQNTLVEARAFFLRKEYSGGPENERGAGQTHVQIESLIDDFPFAGGEPGYLQLINMFPDEQTYLRELLDLEQRLAGELAAAWPIQNFTRAELDEIQARLQARLAKTPAKRLSGSPLLKEISWIVVISLIFLFITQRIGTNEVTIEGPPPYLVLPTQTSIVLTADSSARVDDQENWEQTRTFVASESEVESLDYSPDGRHLAIGSSDSWVRIWGFFDESRFYTLKGHDNPITVVRYSPSGRYLVSGSEDGAIRVWQPANLNQRAELDVHPGPIRTAAFSPDSSLLAVGTERRLWLWEIQENVFIRFYEIAGDDISSVSFSPSSDLLAYADGRTVKILGLPSLEELLVYQNHAAPIHRIAFSSDGRSIASASRDGLLNLVQLSSPAEGLLDGLLMLSIHHPGPIENLSFSPGGLSLAVTGEDENIYLWRTKTGELLARIEGGGLGGVYSPDGRSLVAIGNAGNIHIWGLRE